jgi:hypothetical protein
MITCKDSTEGRSKRSHDRGFFHEHHRASQVTCEVLLVGFRSFSSVLVSWNLDFISVATSSPCKCAHVHVSGSSGNDFDLPREQVRRREGVASESIRLQAGQSEDLVCADHPSHALHYGPVVWCDTSDGGASASSTVFC